MPQNNNVNLSRTSDVEIEDNITFEKMMLSENVLLGLSKNNFIKPSPIQLRAIPLGRCGLDLIIQAKSGTGKTLVYATVILEKFQPHIDRVQSLVVVPTREMAVQIESVIQKIGAYTPGFNAVSVIGGMDIYEDRERLQNCHSLIGTPGRILDLINRRMFCTDHIKLFVMDEADKLVATTFRSDIRRLHSLLPSWGGYQRIALSATYCDNKDEYLKQWLRDAVCVTPKREVPVLLGVKQFVFDMTGMSNDATNNTDTDNADADNHDTNNHDTNNDVTNNDDNNDNINDNNNNDNEIETNDIDQGSVIEMMLKKIEIINIIFKKISFQQCIIFSNSHSCTESYCNYLNQKGWPADMISAGYDQPTRLKVFKLFRELKTRILVSTDLLARGIDSEHVDLVINIDIPWTSVTYLHRIGRCGRFGNDGIAITLVNDSKDMKKFRNMLGRIGGSEMYVFKFPTDDQIISDIWDFSNRDEDFENYGVIYGLEDTANKTNKNKKKNKNKNKNNNNKNNNNNDDDDDDNNNEVTSEISDNEKPYTPLIETISQITNPKNKKSQPKISLPGDTSNKLELTAPDDVNGMFNLAISDICSDENRSNNTIIENCTPKISIEEGVRIDDNSTVTRVNINGTSVTTVNHNEGNNKDTDLESIQNSSSNKNQTFINIFNTNKPIIENSIQNSDKNNSNNKVKTKQNHVQRKSKVEYTHFENKPQENVQSRTERVTNDQQDADKIYLQNNNYDNRPPNQVNLVMNINHMTADNLWYRNYWYQVMMINNFVEMSKTQHIHQH